MVTHQKSSSNLTETSTTTSLKVRRRLLTFSRVRGFKQWIYAQWQSGDVWGYAPYLSKLERDILVYGNAQFAELDAFGD